MPLRKPFLGSLFVDRLAMLGLIAGVSFAGGCTPSSDSAADVETTGSDIEAAADADLGEPTFAKNTVFEFSAMSGLDIDWGSGPSKELYAKNDIRNQQAPDLFVEQWLTETPEIEGKFVLIDFWATWCPPCRAAIPELNKFASEFSEDLVVIGISDETVAKVKAMSSPSIEYFSAVDSEGRTKSAIGVQGIPHVVLIDPSGKVAWQGFPMDDEDPLNEEVIQQQIARYKNSPSS